MIKGADRKEGTKIMQFRAPSEYNGMVELITTALNKQIAEVGSKDKITTTDVIKLAIEALATGDNSFNILGNNMKIDELVSDELKSFYREYSKIIPKKLIEFEVKCCLVKKIKEIVDILEEMMIDNSLEKSSKTVEELMILKATLFSRQQVFDSMKASKEEKEAFGFVQLKSIEYYLDIIIKEYDELELKVEEIDYEILKSEIENNILRYRNTLNMSALKLYDNYKYSFILNSLRKDIDRYVNYIEEYLTHKNDPFIENEREGGEVWDIEDDVDYYEDSTYKSEYDLRPGDPGYEFSVAEAIDNMYDK